MRRAWTLPSGLRGRTHIGFDQLLWPSSLYWHCRIGRKRSGMVRLLMLDDEARAPGTPNFVH